ncbi:MAG: hypothetical protein SFV81_20540 [Pirellulaceae bacterium]|nr:hypothetical protein [Pirellulaceae bacterium]
MDFGSVVSAGLTELRVPSPLPRSEALPWNALPWSLRLVNVPFHIGWIGAWDHLSRAFYEFNAELNGSLDARDKWSQATSLLT